MIGPVLLGGHTEGGQVEEGSDPTVEGALLVPGVNLLQELVGRVTSLPGNKEGVMIRIFF